MAYLSGIDISNWQSDIDAGAVAGDFVICKATEGTGYVSPSCNKQYQSAKKAGKKLGVYHYANGGDYKAEADYFIKNIKGYIGEAILCLDWESQNNPKFNSGQDKTWVKNWCDYVYQQTGVKPLVYVSASYRNLVNGIGDYGLWVAQYADNNTTGYQSTPWNEGAYSCAIRQYSSHGRISGYGGNLDLDKFYGDKAAWDKYANPSGAASPSTNEAEEGMALSYPYAAAEIMEHLCNHNGNGGHGYSQAHRQGIGTGGGAVETITLSDGTSVSISNGDRDCSSAVIECYAALGVDVGGATYTGNMKSCMTKTGNFRWEPMGNGYIAKRGDIYLNEAHHTAMCLDDDPDTLGQFSISETGGVNGQRGDQTGYESNIKAYYNYPWDGKLVYCGPARAGETSHTVSQPAMQDTSGKIEVDGLWGNATTLLLQQVLGAPYKDGIISRQNPAHKNRMPGCTLGWEWGLGDGSGSQTIKLLQKKVGVTQDGIMGPDTINALIKYYKTSSGATVLDGRLDSPSLTIKAMQRALNNGKF